MDTQLSVTLTPQQIFALQSVVATRMDEASRAARAVEDDQAAAATHRQIAIENEELWERLHEQVQSPTAPCEE